LLVRLLATDGDWVLTLARMVLGVIFFAHGAQKLFGWFGGHGLRATVSTFHDQLGIPVPLAYLAVAVEFFGGLGLIVGLLSRIAALGVAATMIVAMFQVHWQFGFFINWFGDRQGHGIEYHLLAIALAAIIIVHGAGAFSLDRALYRRFASSSSSDIALDLGLRAKQNRLVRTRFGAGALAEIDFARWPCSGRRINFAGAAGRRFRATTRTGLV
jgi:putative oxidoreductase